MFSWESFTTAPRKAQHPKRLVSRLFCRWVEWVGAKGYWVEGANSLTGLPWTIQKWFERLPFCSTVLVVTS